MRKTTLGTGIDGPLRQYVVFDENAWVPAPKSLSLVQATTLPCAAVTAWNALHGLSDYSVTTGDVVLIQGTGGVSLFAVQFALAAGATVIATTSSAEKEKMLKEIGVHHVINYIEDLNWGDTAKSLAGGEGVTHIVEVGGPATFAQSIRAIRAEGIINVIGFLGGMDATEDPSYAAGFMDSFKAAAIVRPVMVGSKALFTEMNSFIDEHDIKPVIDGRIFGFSEVREAYEYMLEQRFIGKIVIKVDE
jgi:NADPH:quinone reductase-like Zn-dependent oxidoreductase